MKHRCARNAAANYTQTCHPWYFMPCYYARKVAHIVGSMQILMHPDRRKWISLASNRRIPYLDKLTISFRLFSPRRKQYADNRPISYPVISRDRLYRDQLQRLSKLSVCKRNMNSKMVFPLYTAPSSRISTRNKRVNINLSFQRGISIFRISFQANAIAAVVVINNIRETILTIVCPNL